VKSREKHEKGYNEHSFGGSIAINSVANAANK
jgi:hypothetical protein